MALWMRETFTNADKGHTFGESGWYQPFTDERGKLFRSCQREYGRCVSKVYVENGETARQVGWCFEKRLAYEDSPDLYTREVWVELYEGEACRHHADTAFACDQPGQFAVADLGVFCGKHLALAVVREGSCSVGYID